MWCSATKCYKYIKKGGCFDVFDLFIFLIPGKLINIDLWIFSKILFLPYNSQNNPVYMVFDKLESIVYQWY